MPKLTRGELKRIHLAEQWTALERDRREARRVWMADRRDLNEFRELAAFWAARDNPRAAAACARDAETAAADLADADRLVKWFDAEIAKVLAALAALDQMGA